MIKVEGHKNLYRDENTNAIISDDKTGYQDYINTRRINSDKQAENDAMKNEIRNS